MRKPEVIIGVIAIVVLGTAIYQTRHDFEVMQNVCQLIFWCTAVVVTCLTYANARTGILQPIRTEVFKLQLAELQNVLSFFVGKTETELREQFGLRELVTANARHLLKDYCLVVLGTPYEPATKLIGKGDGWRPLNTPVIKAIQREPWRVPAYKTKDERTAFWESYSLSGLILPKSYGSGLQEIRNCLAHPVLPDEVKSQIELYIGRANEYVTVLEATLNECAKQLPQRYDTRKSLDIIRDGTVAESWISNSFYREISNELSLRTLACGVVESIRTHLQVEQIVKQ